MTFRSNVLRTLFFCILIVAGAFCVCAQNVKRVVILKIDGLPGYYADRFVHQRDMATGKSVLPWFDEVFYKNGTRVPNFYTRGMSLSGPSWGQLDTGRHLQIKGNVEYDRFSLRGYDYLNFVPFYIEYGLGKKADMPAVEVLDQLEIPILCDAFPFNKRYTSQQLYQRGNDWAVLASAVVNLYPGNPSDFIDEWVIGFDVRKFTIDQTERDVLGKLVKRPEIDYYDYYDGAFDHVSHHNNDTASRFAALKDLDHLIGKMWTAIQNSSRADETALILVSDHGINSEEKIYGQGFNLVKLFASSSGGGNHVITKRRLMLDYSIKGIYPLVPLVTTTSNVSNYLNGESSKYPTVLVDFDGNERSSIHLRNNDLNVIQILLQQLQREKLSPEIKTAARNVIFRVIDKHRNAWRQTAGQLNDELDALHRWIGLQQKIIPTLELKVGKDKSLRGVIEQNRRVLAQTDIAIQTEADYRKYVKMLNNLLALTPETFDAKKLRIEDLVAPGTMGDPNSIYDLQNYAVGPSISGLRLDGNNALDLERSFMQVDYLNLLHDQKVRSNVQPEVSNRPIDFVAVRLPAKSLVGVLPAEDELNEDPIWLNSGDEKQTLILSRVDKDGVQSYRYLPVSNLKQDADGKVTFEMKEWGDGFPLKYFEDKNFAVPPSRRTAWLGEWHTEIEWFGAVHKTMYSNAIIGLNEQIERHPLFADGGENLSEDENLIRRLRQRQRQLTEADMLILANNHWNFDVRGFNPGGNHGSFLRVSTNSTLMFAGGIKTGIPRGLSVEAPYDGLSFMPTVMRLMGKVDDQNEPLSELRARGFRKFPGRVITEITGTAK
ncbi:MAG: alkaline phosphatase family protein [Pyrinomonadaceae bacterium]